MQKYRKIRPVRFNRPNPKTALGSGQPNQESQPTEFRLAAFADPDTHQLRVFVSANLPQQPDFLWVATAITFAPEEGSPQGIYPLRNLDAWCAVEHLKSRLFAVFGEAICMGIPVQPHHVRAVVDIEGYFMEHRTDMPQWVARIKAQLQQGRLDLQQACHRLQALERLIDALEAPFLLFDTSALNPR